MKTVRNVQGHPPRDTFYGAACEAINFLEASCSAGAPTKGNTDKAEALRCLDEAEKQIRAARAYLNWPEAGAEA